MEVFKQLTEHSSSFFCNSEWDASAESPVKVFYRPADAPPEADVASVMRFPGTRSEDIAFVAKNSMNKAVFGRGEHEVYDTEYVMKFICDFPLSEGWND